MTDISLIALKCDLVFFRHFIMWFFYFVHLYRCPLKFIPMKWSTKFVVRVYFIQMAAICITSIVIRFSPVLLSYPLSRNRDDVKCALLGMSACMCVFVMSYKCAWTWTYEYRTKLWIKHGESRNRMKPNRCINLLSN